MRDPDRGVGRVDALPTWARGAVDVDLEVVRVDLHLDLLGLRHDGHRRRGGVDPPLRLRGWNPLDAMGAALPLENRVRAVPSHLERDLVEAAGLARVGPQDVPLEPSALRIAGEHPEEIAGPDRALVAAGALADLDDDVLGVVRVALDQ